MSNRETIARLRDEENRIEFDIHRRESAMAAEEREMERAMRAFEEDADQAKRSIRAEWRREHWGRRARAQPGLGNAELTSRGAPVSDADWADPTR